MEKVKLILGNISFEGDFAVVHEIKGILECHDVETATELGDDLINIFEAYVIPSEFNGIIIDENGEEIDVEMLLKIK
jgi:hypothetical protein